MDIVQRYFFFLAFSLRVVREWSFSSSIYTFFDPAWCDIFV